MKTVRDRREVERLYHPPWKRYLRDALHGLALSVLLAAGTIWTIHQQNPAYTKPATLLRVPGAVINAPSTDTETFKVSRVLRLHTRNGLLADRIAAAVVREGRRARIDPALLVGVILVEDATLNPRARSFMGARGLMQVMPFHRGKWGCRSADLYDVETNICHGVRVLAQAIKDAPNLRAALLRYNGCVRGKNTPNCHTYSGKVLRARARTAQQMQSVSTTFAQ